jgi:hypothetical protein
MIEITDTSCLLARDGLTPYWIEWFTQDGLEVTLFPEDQIMIWNNNTEVFRINFETDTNAVSIAHTCVQEKVVEPLVDYLLEKHDPHGELAELLTSTISI